MKKLALISTYCDNEEKISILKKNLQILKSIDLDVLVLSPIKIEIDTDYLFLTKENPILSWPEKGFSIWRTLNYHDKVIKLQHFPKDTSWASLYHLKKLMEIGGTLNYDLYYVMIYDLEIDEQIVSDIKNNIYNITYPRRDFVNKDIIYPISFHFSIFDKKNTIHMGNLINENEYKSQDGFAEDFMEKWAKKLNLQVSNHVVNDLIYNAPSDIFNASKNIKYKFFINREIGDRLKLYVYDYENTLEINLNDTYLVINQNPILIQLPIFCEELNYFSIVCDGEKNDYSQDYKKIIRNIIQIM